MSELTSTIFTLTAREDTALPVDSGRILQAAFLNWLKPENPELVAKLHDANHDRPYTVSALQGPFAREKGWLKIHKGQEGWFRVTGFEAYFAECVHKSVAAQGVGPQPDDARLLPGAVHTAANEHEWSGESSFERIAAEVARLSGKGALAEEVILQFASSTCFFENKQSLPLPIPSYVFGYLTNRWQLASPFPLPVEDVQHFVDSIHLAFARIETRMVDLKKYRRVGFVGLARFALHPALPEIYRQALHVLAKFSFFCGVGSHTTSGMGQVRQIARERKMPQRRGAHLRVG